MWETYTRCVHVTHRGHVLIYVLSCLAHGRATRWWKGEQEVWGSDSQFRTFFCSETVVIIAFIISTGTVIEDRRWKYLSQGLFVYQNHKKQQQNQKHSFASCCYEVWNSKQQRRPSQSQRHKYCTQRLSFWFTTGVSGLQQVSHRTSHTCYTVHLLSSMSLHTRCKQMDSVCYRKTH